MHGGNEKCVWNSGENYGFEIIMAEVIPSAALLYMLIFFLVNILVRSAVVQTSTNVSGITASVSWSLCASDDCLMNVASKQYPLIQSFLTAIDKDSLFLHAYSSFSSRRHDKGKVAPVLH
jgi:hypothetical protein